MLRRWGSLSPVAAILALLFVHTDLSAGPAKSGNAAPSEPTQDSVNIILDTQRTLWRFRTVRETREIVRPSGEVDHARVVLETRAKSPTSWFQKNPDTFEAPAECYTIERLPIVRLPAETAADWMKPGFDDGNWARLRGPALNRTADNEWKVILMRGLFEVSDPAKAGDLTLSLTFRGGAVVYLNGEEVIRSAMRKGPIDLYTSAEPYPLDAYFTSEGYVFERHDRREAVLPHQEKRIRRATDITIPATRLRPGVNVLAVSIHRAPTAFQHPYLGRYKGLTWTNAKALWAKIGLIDIQLSAQPGAAVVPNVGLLKDRGFKVWNQSIVQTVFLTDYPDPFSPLVPIHLTGMRNGTFAGQVVVSDDKPIRGLEVEVSELKGPGTIPASAALVRFAVADGRGRLVPFDSLEDDPPAEVPLYKEHGRALQPIWVTVTVPADAKPGDYSGTVTIRAEGVKPVTVPLDLHVADWILPPASQFVATLDIIQSPESVAMAYNVPLWSDEHFKHLDRTFSLLGPLGVKTLYITCIRRTHFGNEHAMVRWIRGEDGELTPDFSILEKYLDMAAKHIGQPRGVILYCWEPWESQGHATHYRNTPGQVAEGIADRAILITMVDPKTGRMTARQGPAWGTPEARTFWKKLTDGIQPVLKKRGLEKAMLFGLIGDRRPTQQAMDDIGNGVAEPKWAIHSHLYCDTWQGYKVAFVIALWGIGSSPRDPTVGYSFGWSNPLWLSYYPREMKLTSTLVEYRTKLETWVGAPRTYGPPAFETGRGPRGLGRIGGDFWKLLKDARGQPRRSLAGRYPEAAWGQLDLNLCIPYVLGKGQKGAVPTVRSEAFREGLQEVETRIYVEKALLDDEAKTLLGDELMARIRNVLDERIRMGLSSGADATYLTSDGQAWYISSGWTERTERLFGLAAEISRRLGREPIPNLKPVPDKKP